MPRHARVAALVTAIYLAACFYTLLNHHMFVSVTTRMAWCFVAALACMALWFLVARHLRRWDIIDIAWGICFVAIALTSFLLQSGWRTTVDVQTLTTALVFLWAARLSWHIGRRFRHSTAEDPRYVALRKNWKGNIATNMFLRVYVVQAFFGAYCEYPCYSH